MHLKQIVSLHDRKEPLALATVPIPQPAVDEVLIRVTACGVCHQTLVPFPIYYNFLHSIELALKSYMLHTDSGLSELTYPKGVGHDSTAALHICIDRGLLDHCPALSDALIKTVELANQMYKRKEFEYLVTGFRRIAHIDQIKIAADTVLERLATIDMRPTSPESV